MSARPALVVALAICHDIVARVILSLEVSGIAPTCLICTGSIAGTDRHQHLTGDYHKACFASVASAGLRVERSETAGSCALCGDGVAAGSVIVRPAQLAVHLACFFIPPRNGRRSLGAAAPALTLSERSVALRQCARVMRRMARCAQERAHAVRLRHAVLVPIICDPG